jgi:hypothetical protein
LQFDHGRDLPRQVWYLLFDVLWIRGGSVMELPCTERPNSLRGASWSVEVRPVPECTAR